MCRNYFVQKSWQTDTNVQIIAVQISLMISSFLEQNGHIVWCLTGVVDDERRDSTSHRTCKYTRRFGEDNHRREAYTPREGSGDDLEFCTIDYWKVEIWLSTIKCRILRIREWERGTCHRHLQSRAQRSARTDEVVSMFKRDRCRLTRYRTYASTAQMSNCGSTAIRVDWSRYSGISSRMRPSSPTRVSILWSVCRNRCLHADRIRTNTTQISFHILHTSHYNDPCSIFRSWRETQRASSM